MLLESSLQFEAMTSNSWHAVRSVIVGVLISVLGTEVQVSERTHLLASASVSESVLLLAEKADLRS